MSVDEVRDKISAFLAERGWPSCMADGSCCVIAWGLTRSPWAAVYFNWDYGRVAVRMPLKDKPEVDLPADAPDLLKRLGKTLDELGA